MQSSSPGNCLSQKQGLTLPKVFLLTGLSGSGKTTLANSVLKRIDAPFILLDGDEVRQGLCSDLGFSAQDREENLRRIGEMAKLLLTQGYNVIVAAIAPYASARKKLQSIIGEDSLLVVHVACPLEVCILRDPKQNYQKAIAGFLPAYTGVGDIYEAPAKPHLKIDTAACSVEDSCKKLHEFVKLHSGARKQIEEIRQDGEIGGGEPLTSPE